MSEQEPPLIVVAGATGKLGERIVKALRGRGARVVALARKGSRTERLEQLGATVSVVDLNSADEIARACAGAACVVSALNGLRDVIVDGQTRPPRSSTAPSWSCCSGPPLSSSSSWAG